MNSANPLSFLPFVSFPFQINARKLRTPLCGLLDPKVFVLREHVLLGSILDPFCSLAEFYGIWRANFCPFWKKADMKLANELLHSNLETRT